MPYHKPDFKDSTCNHKSLNQYTKFNVGNISNDEQLLKAKAKAQSQHKRTITKKNAEKRASEHIKFLKSKVKVTIDFS